MSFPRPPLVIARKPRVPGQGWEEANSWFGGRPRLGGLSWPRDATSNEPLVFVAQIDLAEIARHAPEFPTQGSLAFFVGARGSCNGAVVHVTGPAAKRATEPPSDSHPVRELGSWPFPDDPGPGVEALFPFWPVQLQPLDIEVPNLDGEDVDLEPMTKAAVAAIAELFPDRGYPSPKSVSTVMGGAALPHWWYSARFLAGCMQNALHRAPKTLAARAPWLQKARAEYAQLTAAAKPKFGVFGRRAAEPSPELERARLNLERVEAENAAYHRDLPRFAALVDESIAFAAAHRPTDLMPVADWEKLADLFSRARGEFEDFSRYALPYDLAEIETQSLIYMLTAEDAAYLTIPDPVRTYVNGHCLLPSSGSWHQMFGIGEDIQGCAIWENADKHLLLQLVYDETMHWRFGDVGAFQFWISPEDVKARRFENAILTFECH